MRTIFILALACLIRIGHAQQPLLQPSISVIGEAELQVEPDQIHISITLMERGTGSNKVTVESQESWLKNAVISLGLDSSALTLSGAMADLIPRNFRSDDVIARKRYQLRVSDAEMVRKVFMELDRLQIHDAGIHRVEHSNEAELGRTMRIQAMRDAKQKADDILGALGVRTGPVLEVSDHPVKEVPRPRGGAFDRMYGGGYRESKRLTSSDHVYEDLGLGFSSITIKAEVYCVFAIAVE